MIIEIPEWLAALFFIAVTLLFGYLLGSDFFVRMIHKKYDLDLIEKKKKIIEHFENKENKDNEIH